MKNTCTGWLPVAALTAASFLWGSSFIALKLAFRAYDPMVVIFGRMAVASVLFLCFYRKYRPERVHPGDLKYLLLMAVCEPCLYFLFEAEALQNTTASQAGMITAMLPLLVVGAARLFLSERVSRQMLTGFILAIAGVVWLSVEGESSLEAPRPALGNFLEFLAMVCAAGYFIILKFLTRSYSPWFLTAVQAFVGSLFYFPLLFLPDTGLPDRFHPVATLSVVYLGAFITIGAYGFYNYGVSRLPVSQASVFVNLIPVFSVLLGWMVLGERFTPPQYLASIVIFAGIFLSQPRRHRPTGAIPDSPERLARNIS